MKRVVKADHCLNCSETLSGENYCPNCGQKNDARRVTTGQLISESLSNLFALDGRLFRTLAALFTMPGKVPLDFKEGKRNRYMNPIRIYFLSTIVMLFAMRLANENPQVADIDVGQGMEDALKDGQKNAIVDSLKLEQPKKGKAGARLNLPVDSLSTQPGTPMKNDLSEEEFTDKVLEMSHYNEKHPEMPVEQALSNLQLKNNLWNRFLYEQAAKTNHMTQEEYNRYFISNLFWVLFFFIPVLGLILKLFYIRRNFYYPEHLFFSFYNQSVLFSLLSLGFFLQIEDSYYLIILLIYSIYLYFSMLRFYGQNWIKTFVKLVFINFLVSLSFVVFVLLSMLVTFLFF